MMFNLLIGSTAIVFMGVGCALIGLGWRMLTMVVYG